MIQKIKHHTIFEKEIYSKGSNVKSAFSVKKRKYSRMNKNKSTQLQNKETRLKTLVTISLKQSKFQKMSSI